jgi:transposase InsO family protein
MIESLWATLKKELVHGSLGYVSPEGFEAAEMVA